MGARKRVRRFLRWWSKDGTHPQEYIAWSGSQVLAVKDLEQLIADSREAKRWRRSAAAKDKIIEDQDKHITKLDTRVAELEQLTAPELPPLPQAVVSDELGRAVAHANASDMALDAVWHALPSEFCKAGETAGQAVLRMVEALGKARQNIAQWNGTEERWTAKREAYEAEIGKLRADSDKLRQLNEARALADKHKRAADKLQQLVDVPEHFAASITKALSQLLTDPDE